MKFRVTMKDPDGLQDAIVDAVKASTTEMADEDERQAVMEVRCEKMGEVAIDWFQYGECLTVEIDTDARTAIVLKTKDVT